MYSLRKLYHHLHCTSTSCLTSAWDNSASHELDCLIPPLLFHLFATLNSTVPVRFSNHLWRPWNTSMKLFSYATGRKLFSVCCCVSAQKGARQFCKFSSMRKSTTENMRSWLLKKKKRLLQFVVSNVLWVKQQHYFSAELPHTSSLPDSTDTYQAKQQSEARFLFKLP